MEYRKGFYSAAFAPFAYVGSKRLLDGPEKDWLGDDDLHHPVLAHLMTQLVTIKGRERWEFREPFLGGGNIALKFLGRFPRRAWLNDFDPGQAALWNAVIRCPDKLIDRICAEKVSEQKWKKHRKRLTIEYDIHREEPMNPLEMPDDELLDLAFLKYAVCLWSHATKGERFSQPALAQRSAQDPANSSLPKRIRMAHDTLTQEKVKLRDGGVTCLDYAAVVSAPGKNLVYCDPPYTMADKGGYYAFNFSDEQHEDLRDRLLKRKHWALSYDLSAKVRKWYGLHPIKNTQKLGTGGDYDCDIVEAKVSMNTLGGRFRNEVFLHDD